MNDPRFNKELSATGSIPSVSFLPTKDVFLFKAVWHALGESMDVVSQKQKAKSQKLMSGEKKKFPYLHDIEIRLSHGHVGNVAHYRVLKLLESCISVSYFRPTYAGSRRQ